jgi:hypothetical protein
MSGRRSAATDSGITMILCGLTLRDAAAKAGVNVSTLVRACAADGIILARGRPPKIISGDEKKPGDNRV